jgi:branched-subunit amino acid aminotransferase/4-amino-4-deoxychorismate lyase
MHPFVYLNDRISASADARISAVSAAALYGRGIFTTIAINESKPFLWEKHWARIRDNAARIRLDISGYSEAKTAEALTHVIDRNGVLSGLARITFFDAGGGPAPETVLLITTRPRREVPANFKLTVSPFRVNSTSPLAGMKSSGYLENLLAIEAARRSGFDEAVRLNERGQIASGCMANIFWEKEGRLFTPSLASGCLAGTTRANILENSGAVVFDAGIEALDGADAIFLTSAGLDRVRVKEFDGRKF